MRATESEKEADRRFRQDLDILRADIDSRQSAGTGIGKAAIILLCLVVLVLVMVAVLDFGTSFLLLGD